MAKRASSNTPSGPTTSAPSHAQAASASLLRAHRRYTEFAPIWTRLGHAVEGTGGFLDGSYLVPHGREQHFGTTSDGTPDFDRVVSDTPQFAARKALARYDNFAAFVIDGFIGYQYAKKITRSVEGPLADAITAWWENVDGDGTHITDWLRHHQTLVNAYGFLWVVADKLQSSTVRSAADEGPVVLRTYVPLDVLDWLASEGEVRAVKVVEAKERMSLLDTVAAGQRGDYQGELDDIQIRIVDANGFRVFDLDGRVREEGEHGIGACPALVWHARRRPNIPLIGRSLLGDGKLFVDHLNVASELRAIMRGQVFSILNIQLGDNQDVKAGRALLGESLGIQSIMWTRGPAGFIAPPDGPVAAYQNEMANIERKIFRLVGMQWDSDSRDAEAADSRRLKAMDLNRLLGLHADEAEKAEYRAVRLFLRAKLGKDRGDAAFASHRITIQHPDEFHVEDVAVRIADTRDAIGVRLGATAEVELKQRLTQVLLPDLDAAVAETIRKEQEEIATSGDALRDALLTSMETPHAGQEPPGVAPDATTSEGNPDAAADQAA